MTGIRPTGSESTPLYGMARLHLGPAFVEAWSAAGMHLEEHGVGDVRWLRAHLNQPLIEHLSFRLGNQLFFIWVLVPGELSFDGGLRELFLNAAAAASAHPCVLRMRLASRGFEPVLPGWGLSDAVTGELVDPRALVTAEEIEMTDWELLDFGIQIVRDSLESEGATEISWQSNLAVDPSVWFERGRGPEWVVVRAVRYPEREAPLPHNVDAMLEAYGFVSNLGHFASVAVAAEGENKERLLRGGALIVRFVGLEARTSAH